MDASFHLRPSEIPARLFVLGKGLHEPDGARASAMEAASWLAAEPWSARPRSVHPVIAAVATRANEALDDDARQCLWPLIVASLDTSRRWRPLLGHRLSRVVRGAKAGRPDELVALWRSLLIEHARLVGPSAAARAGLDLARLGNVGRRRARPARARLHIDHIASLWSPYF